MNSSSEQFSIVVESVKTHANLSSIAQPRRYSVEKFVYVEMGHAACGPLKNMKPILVRTETETETETYYSPYFIIYFYLCLFEC